MTLKDKKNINRLTIYFFYDNDGIVDRYVVHMLEEMKTHSSEVFVVCNGKLTAESREKLKAITPEENILVRDNTGFDVWAYKDALDHYGWKKLEEFDEVVLMNYTVFGPLYPFKDMFEEMNKKDVDFWGITKHHKVNYDVFGTCKYHYIPEHIQSSFLVIRQSLMKTNEYHRLWDNMSAINSYADSVGLYEAIFTKDFNDKGFKSAVYIDTSDIEGYTRYPLMMMADEMIINRKCPIMKVKSFSQNYFDILGDTIGACSVNAFDYIKKNLSYDTDLMLEHVIRTANMADLKKLLHLNYILPTEYAPKKPATPSSRVALMMHLYFPDLIEKCLNYAKSMPEGCDLFITVPNDNMNELVTKALKSISTFKSTKVITIENRGRDVSSLLVGFAPYVDNYDLVCFMHDKKTKQIEPFCQGESFSYKCFENCLATKEYVENILCTFEENPRLGMLMPPPPNHGPWWNVLGSEWFCNYDNTKKLAEKLKLSCPISPDREPITPLGTMFWFRPVTLKKLFDNNGKKWKYTDFPKEPNNCDGTLLHAIERIYGFAVQDSGHYCAWTFTDRFSKIELTNLAYMLRCVNIGTRAPIPAITKGRRRFKNFFKKIIPRKMWKKMRESYHRKGGTKWVG